MVTSLLVYRNHQGEAFYRLSPTHGRTGSYRVEAESPEQLERWLFANGFELVSDRAAA